MKDKIITDPPEKLTDEQIAVMYDELFQLDGWKHFCENIVRLAEKCNTLKDITPEVLNNPVSLAAEIRARKAKHDAYMGLINQAKINAKKISKTLEKIKDKKHTEEV